MNTESGRKESRTETRKKTRIVERKPSIESMQSISSICTDRPVFLPFLTVKEVIDNP